MHHYRPIAVDRIAPEWPADRCRRCCATAAPAQMRTSHGDGAAAPTGSNWPNAVGRLIAPRMIRWPIGHGHPMYVWLGWPMTMRGDIVRHANGPAVALRFLSIRSAFFVHCN